MPKVIIEVELGNAAMQTGFDVAEAVYDQACKQLQQQQKLVAGTRHGIRDENGNTVGHWRVTHR